MFPIFYQPGCRIVSYRISQEAGMFPIESARGRNVSIESARGRMFPISSAWRSECFLYVESARCQGVKVPISSAGNVSNIIGQRLECFQSSARCWNVSYFISQDVGMFPLISQRGNVYYLISQDVECFLFESARRSECFLYESARDQNIG